MDDQERYDAAAALAKLLADAHLGADIEREIAGSRVVKLILERAEQEKTAAQKQFPDIDLATELGRATALELQQVIRRSNSIGNWLKEAITRGQEAAAQLPQGSEGAEGTDIESEAGPDVG